MANGNEFWNENEIRKAVSVLKPNGEPFEVRIIGDQYNMTGYFDDVEMLVTGLKHLNLNGYNCYFTLNSISDDCMSRSQSNRFVRAGKKTATTADNDVEAYSWLFIDIDTERKTGISSTDPELKESYALAKRVYQFLQAQGFEEPVKAMSGNGAHLLYKVGLENNSENKEIVENSLKALDYLFSTDKVHVDSVNFNPARICKMYGTLAQKGASTKTRPHRMSRILSVPAEIKRTPKAMLQKIADMLPVEPEAPQQYNNYQPKEFDLDQWLSEHGIQYSPKSYRDGEKYVLDECPFDHSHKSPDSAIFKMSSGAIGFRCLHNSCQGKTWKDVRLLFEPDAYEQKHEADDRDRAIEEGWQRHNRDKQDIVYEPVQEEQHKEPMFQTPLMILSKPEEKHEYIRTGIKAIDRKIKGLEKGTLSVTSGLRASAKSTWLSQVMINAVNDGQNVICYSGELSSVKFMKWMYLQAAGKNNTIKSKQYENTFYTRTETNKLIAEWMGDRFWLYNNDYGNNFSKIADVLATVTKEKKADLVVIDNLMALDLRDYGQDKYDAQTNFVWKLKELAELSNAHVIFVAHPRKANGFLRLDDISGTGNIANIVDNAFIVHRNNEDFRRLSKDMFGWKETNDVYTGSNVIEIAKNRDDGVQDEFIPLWYEMNTKRLKNDIGEYVHYGWETTDNGFIDQADDDELIPF